MIPRKIHYCWFSGDSYPEKVLECIASWKKYMPDWEYVLWDSKKIQSIDSVWLKECIDAQKWAFAADFIRLYAIYHEGGVYLDSDVEVFQSFDPLLHGNAFIGREWTWHTEKFLNQQYLSSHCMGAEAGNAFMGRCLNYYKDRHFILQPDSTLPDALRYNQMLLPQIQCELLMQSGYDPGLHGDHKVSNLIDIDVYPSVYFDPYQVKATSYCRHWCQGGWLTGERSRAKITLSYRIKYKLDLWLKLLITRIWHL